MSADRNIVLFQIALNSWNTGFLVMEYTRGQRRIRSGNERFPEMLGTTGPTTGNHWNTDRLSDCLEDG
jgi:hypothetical protein